MPVNSIVTGAGGFIGGHLVGEMKAIGSVVAVDKKRTHDWKQAHDVKNIDQDVRSFNVAWKECNVIFHLAAEARIQPSFQEPGHYLNNNIQATVSAIELARKLDATFIYAGSSTADYDVMANPYAYSKWSGEEITRLYARHFNVKAAIARFYNVYGKYQSEPNEGPYPTVMGVFQQQYRDGLPLTVTGDGAQRRDFTHVMDIVYGMIAIAMNGKLDGEVYNIGRGENFSILEVATMFGSEIKFIDRPPGEAEVSLADNQSLMDIGWTPQMDLDRYVEDVKRIEDVKRDEPSQE